MIKHVFFAGENIKFYFIYLGNNVIALYVCGGNVGKSNNRVHVSVVGLSKVM